MGKDSSILDMISNMLDSTFILHGKAKVHSTVQKKWNNTVERIYNVFYNSAPNIYHEFKIKLKSYLKITKDEGEMFFYYEQLTLLALIENQKEETEDYCKKLVKLRANAGIFSERISDKVLSEIKKYMQE